MVADTATSSSPTGCPHAPRGDFSPDPTLAAQILDDLSNPDLSLRDIAREGGTTLEALTTWLAREDINDRVETLESATARRARFVATTFLPRAAQALASIIDQYNHDVANVPVNPSSVIALEHRRRASETARRAAAVLLRIANFSPGPRRACSSQRSPGTTSAAHRNDLPDDPDPAPLSEPEEAAIRRVLEGIGTGELHFDSQDDLLNAVAEARESARAQEPLESQISDLKFSDPPPPAELAPSLIPSPSSPAHLLTSPPAHLPSSPPSIPARPTPPDTHPP